MTLHGKPVSEEELRGSLKLSASERLQLAVIDEEWNKILEG